MKIFILLLLILSIQFHLQSQQVTPNFNFNSINGEVNSVVADSDYTYVGGSFSYIGPNYGQGVVVDKNTAGLNNNFPKVNGTIYCSVSDENGGWYIGGEFTKVGNYSRSRLAHIRADGSVSGWDPNANNTVLTIAFNGYYVFAAGQFTSVGGRNKYLIAMLDRINGTAYQNWNVNINTSSYGYISSIKLFENFLIAGGAFVASGQFGLIQIELSIGYVNGSWAPDINSNVDCMAGIGNDLYVGGAFTEAGNIETRVAKIDVYTGEVDTLFKSPEFQGGFFNRIKSIAVLSSGVYVQADSTQSGRVIKLNNTTGAHITEWNAPYAVTSMMADGEDLYLGNSHLVKVDPFTGVEYPWKIYGYDGGIRTLSISAGNIFIGGDFTSMGGNIFSNLARIQNKKGTPDPGWHPVVSGSISKMLMSGNDLFIAGNFESVGGSLRKKLAKLRKNDGVVFNNWTADITGSANMFVSSIAIIGDDLIVGGNFTSVNGVARVNLAKINYTSGEVDEIWDPQVSGDIHAISTNSSNIFIGGSFSNLSGSSVKYLAKLNNTSGAADINWSAFPNHFVKSLTLKENNLYLGGSFAKVNNETRKNAAKVDINTGVLDNEWKPNGDWDVLAIAVRGNDVYLGGLFNTMGGVQRRYAAKVNSTDGAIDVNWNPSPLNKVTCLVTTGDDLYMNGGFNYSPEYKSSLGLFTDRLVYAEENTTSTINTFLLEQNYPNPFNPVTRIDFHIPQSERVVVKVYNIMGEHIVTLQDGFLNSGNHSLNFNAVGLSSGVYFYRVETGSFNQTKKMVYLK